MTTVTVNAWCAPQKLRMPDGSIVVMRPGESLTAEFDDAQMREIEVSPGHFTVRDVIVPLPLVVETKPQPVQQHRHNRRGRR